MKRFLSVEDVGKVLTQARAHSKRDHLLLLLSFQHGLRVSEAAGLTLEDIAGGYLRVKRVKHSLETCQPLLTNADPLFDEPSALQEWLTERPTKTDALFPSQKGGGHLWRESVSALAARYMIQAGLPAELCHAHSLKHAICSLLIRNGVGIEYVAEQVGHKDIKNTRLYLHISQEEVAAKAQAVLNTVVHTAMNPVSEQEAQ